MRHTPGPWHYRRLDEWTHTVVTNHGELPDGQPSDWAVASINKNREPEHEANARLIAAAPDLLEVLQWFMPFIESEQDDERQAPWVEKARAAIAKATGEPK